MLLTEIPVLDAVLRTHAAELGGDFGGYRNHAYRVVNFSVALSSSDPERLEKLAIAAAFHDLGIWTDGTFDYVPPSIALATAHLTRSGRSEWVPEIAGMIREHHKISRFLGDPRWLVEPFRRADWIDVSLGLVRSGLPRALLREIFSAWPDEGFHKRLVQLFLVRLGTHPWNPLPMLRL
jgi:hypothetical protein